MSTRYASDIRGAQKSIRESGEACTLIRYTTTPPDAAKPWQPGTPAEETLPVWAVFLNYNLQGSGESYVDGSLVHTGDKKVLLAGGLAWNPDLNGAVRRADGTLWKIVNVKTLDPDGAPILFTLQVRQ